MHLADVNILLTFDRLLKSVRLLATALVLKERPKGEVNYIGNDIDRDWLIFAIACKVEDRLIRVGVNGSLTDRVHGKGSGSKKTFLPVPMF